MDRSTNRITSRKIVDTHCRYGDDTSFCNMGPGGCAARGLELCRGAVVSHF